MALLKFSGEDYTQDVEREGFFFSNLRELAEDNFSGPGKSFELELELVPVTGYYGMDKAIIVRDSISTLGWLPSDAVDRWWNLFCAIHDAGESIEVPGRVWTSRDWENDFYASVRLDMPSVADAESELESEGVELTAANRDAWKSFSNYIEEYWDPRWVEAHGMSAEEVERRVEDTRRRIAGNSVQNDMPPAVGGVSAPGGSGISRPLLWVLWLFLGLAGGHRFYLGNIGIGALQFLTIGGFGVWWIVDAFLMHGRVRAVESGVEPRVKF